MTDGQTGAPRGAPPIIGVTAYEDPARWGVWIREATLLPASYPRAIERAGGVPVLIPPTDALDGLPALMRRLDGVVLAGGPDVDPALYGARRHPETGPPHPRRDRFELALVRAVLEAGLPFLAVCRGMQLLNVALGGTLLQHLPEVVGHEEHLPAPGRIGRHRVRIAPECLLGAMLGDQVEVPTYHHQAVDRLGAGLVPVAWTDDRVVEAVELSGHRFGLGVQWHPEDGDDLRLFAGLVAEAGGG
ncbi:gamma-glutamyl-gamma-aminobutyrate hydrolase family protein [Thermomonospora catenispora]|uniref:gamma-glutamyl-gamma-aminobutyrate hydrolase family protein n=1 Tax=Thermomonospora catenispora TaxID=2493090 RepID=UPI00111D4731|nr:gamma-glutamyl-gamma-aminobutyrate hydrolase family protein [Thermomonospora catenispora]TNY36366.1 gamma-glutamyl-gamma-aminobutyrate hydrolase family protein [Thermomonospora catenispora]